MGKNSAGRKPQQNKGAGPLWLIAGAVVIVVGGLIGYNYFANQPTPQSPATTTPGAAVQPVAGVKTDTEQGAKGNVKGPASAKVKLVEYADFQCPVCGTAHKLVEPQLAPLIASGQVQFTYKHYTVVDSNTHGLESQWAAEAAECAGDQDKFWAMHDYLFEHQNGEGQGAFSIAHLKEFAVALGLNSATFNTCIDTHKYRDRVQQETREAENLRLEGTPSFLMNGKLIPMTKFDDIYNAVSGAVKK